MMFVIEASEQEIVALRQMLHRACLHSGMDVAEAAAHWNRKLIAAMMAAMSNPHGNSLSEIGIPEETSVPN